MCCNTTQQQGAWKQVVAYHDLCAHDQVPMYIEDGFHDYEASCENFFCNLVGPDVDQTVCPPPPSPPPSKGVEPAVLTGAAALLALFAICIFVMICKEKSGKPIFTNLE